MADKIVSNVDEDTFLITSEKFERESFEKAVYDFTNKSNFKSTYFNESSGLINFKIEDIDSLAYNAQTNLMNITKINSIVRYFVNKDSILGKLFEAIEINVNSDWDLSYPNYDEKDSDTFNQVDTIIKRFNEKIGLDDLITKSIPMTYMDGNYFLYLRKDIENDNYQVDFYPIGICEIADYSEGNEPYLLVNMKELESRLRKVYKKNKKNQPLFYKSMEDEIKDTYPKEVYDAYINKEQYAILNIKNSGVMRINNLNRKYGLSPIFKALKPVIRLENIELSDDKSTLIRGKKIIFQKLSKELITKSKEIPNITWSSAQAKSHVDLMSALNQNGVTVFTAPPWTESIEYVESKLEPTNVQVKNEYKNQIMTSIGISHLSADKGSYGAAQISITELLKTINRISEQLEKVLVKWYKGILVDLGFDPLKYCPKIKIMDSEKLNAELSIQLAKLLNTELNASLETVYNTLGLDVDTEARRRQRETELGYEEIFKPRMTAYTNNGDNSDDSGRPSDSDDLEKQDYDKEYNGDNGR
ncbi:hypothetical protein [uncultured Metabacillus sp.]|uniref:hypothetical protein n=1 Tax=uncultured Metabacillus sp. TaxID=2860135 RepID=UPI0026185E4D|nr:hypothetical protein [uncultured Metabacillus sp.]